MRDETDQKDIAKLDIPGSKHANLGSRVSHFFESESINKQKNKMERKNKQKKKAESTQMIR